MYLTENEILNRVTKYELSFVEERLSDLEKLYRMGIIQGLKEAIGKTTTSLLNQGE